MSKSIKGIDAVEKVKLVERYLNGEVSISSAAKEISINIETFRLGVRLEISLFLPSCFKKGG